jgi:hypothetical protein
MPWKPLTPADVEAAAGKLKTSGVLCAGLSAHDSSDDALSIFRDFFEDRYYELKVGLPVAF